MGSLSLTVCGFSLMHKGKVFNLNENIGGIYGDIFDLLTDFCNTYSIGISNDIAENKGFQCSYDSKKDLAESHTSHSGNISYKYRSFISKVTSGDYGTAEKFFNIKTGKKVFDKGVDDVPMMPFSFAVFVPESKQSDRNYKIVKGLLVFQNNGLYGIKTVFKKYFHAFIKEKLNANLILTNIAALEYIYKLFEKARIKNIHLINHELSIDESKIYNKSLPVKSKKMDIVLRDPIINDSDRHVFKRAFTKAMSSLRGETLLEFTDASLEVDDLKIDFDFYGKPRTVSSSRINSMNPVELIPESIKGADGHPIEDVLKEYLLENIPPYINYLDMERIGKQ